MVIGIAPLLYSMMDISIGSITLSAMSASTGEPMLICKALAPMILALSNRVYFTIATSLWRYPLKYGSFIYVLGPVGRLAVADGYPATCNGCGKRQWPPIALNSYGYRIQMFEIGGFPPK